MKRLFATNFGLFAALMLVIARSRALPKKTRAPTKLKKRRKSEEDRKGSQRTRKRITEEIGNRDVGKGVNFYSLEKEIGLGKQLAQEVERQAKIIDDPVIAEYVNRVGQNLVRNSDAKVPFTIKVLDSEEVNAFALPGGFFFVNSGLILKAENEAELAGVMAHEIAHVAARHGTRQATRGQIVNFAIIPLIFMGGWTGYAIRQGASVAVPMGFLKFSRGFEQEADLPGPAVSLQVRLRSDGLRRLLRKDPVAGEEEARHHVQGLLHAPDDRRPHQGLRRRTFRRSWQRSPNTWSPRPSSTM